MCYKCEVCLAISPPGDKRRTYVVMRRVPKSGLSPEREEIEREISVCMYCEGALRSVEDGGLGVSLRDLTRQHGRAIPLSSRVVGRGIDPKRLAPRRRPRLHNGSAP